MEDFFDDFDWEDMAMVGGLADALSEEERDRRRREREDERESHGRGREEYLDPEDKFDFDNGFRRRPTGSHFSGRRPRRKPFEQYAYEVARGLKHHHDPLFGPAKPRRGVSRGPQNFTDTILYGVLVKNAHLASENFLKFVCTVLYGHRDQEIDCIIFDPDGNPVVDGHEVFSTFDRGSRIITMNLRRHFANAVRVAEHGYTGFSIHSLIWDTMVSTFLHEFKHALDACEIGYMDSVPRDEQERIADQWAAEAKTYFARQGQCEMPELSEEPFFGPLVNQFIRKVCDDESPKWVQEQREMIDTGTFYRNKEAGIEINTMQELYEHSYQGLEQDEFGRRLNACLKRAHELEKKIWNQEEMCELALKEAISTSHKVRVKHLDAFGAQFSQTLWPQTITTKHYYLWLEAADEKSSEISSIRVDRILEVVFLA